MRRVSCCCSLSTRVHPPEEGLSELVGADHDGAGRGHLDHSGHEPWGRIHSGEPANADRAAEAERLPYLQTGLCSPAPPRFPSWSATWTRFSSEKLQRWAIQGKKWGKSGHMAEDTWKKSSDLPANPFLPAGSVSGSSPRRTAASGWQRPATQTPR